jgi:hypothetical protein
MVLLELFQSLGTVQLDPDVRKMTFGLAASAVEGTMAAEAIPMASAAIAHPEERIDRKRWDL